jgi:hypothetical protein
MEVTDEEEKNGKGSPSATTPSADAEDADMEELSDTDPENTGEPSILPDNAHLPDGLRARGSRSAAAEARTKFKGLLSSTSEPSGKRKRKVHAANDLNSQEQPSKRLRTRDPDIPLPLPRSSAPKEKPVSTVPKLLPINEDPPEMADGMKMKLFFIDGTRPPMDYNFKPPKQTVSRLHSIHPYAISHRFTGTYRMCGCRKNPTVCGTPL